MEPVKPDLELLSSTMAAFAHVRANPESFALCFMVGVCFGLLAALCLLVAAIACRARRPRPPPPSPERRQLKESSEEEEEEEDEEDDEEEEEEERCRPPDGTLRGVNVFSSAEELETARRLEERERIVREIWRNGQPDVLFTGTGTIGRGTME